jgi:hypothetical protein
LITDWNTKYKHIFIVMHHYGEADVVSKVQARHPRCRGLISIRGQGIFYFSKNLALRPTQVCYSMGTRWGSCLGVRQLRQEADYSLPDTNLRIHHIPSLHADGQLSFVFSLLHDKEIIYGYCINFPTRIDYSNAINPLAPEFSFKFWHTLYLKCE